MKNIILVFVLLTSQSIFSQSWVVNHSSNTNAKTPVIALQIGNLYYSIHNETINKVSCFRVVCLAQNLKTVLWDKSFTYSASTIINHGLVNRDGNIFLVGEQNSHPYYCLLNTSSKNLTYAKIISGENARIHKVIELSKSQNDYAFVGTNIDGSSTTKKSYHGRIKHTDGSLAWAFKCSLDEIFRGSYGLCEINNGNIVLCGGNYNSTDLSDNMLVELNPGTGAITSTNTWSYTYTYQQIDDATNTNIDNIINIPGTNRVAFLYHVVKYDFNAGAYVEGSRDYGVTVFDFSNKSIVWDKRYVRKLNIGERGNDIVYNTLTNELIVSSRVTSNVTPRERFIHFIDPSNGNTNKVYNLNNIALTNTDLACNLFTKDNSVLYISRNDVSTSSEIIMGYIDLNNTSPCFKADQYTGANCNKSATSVSIGRLTVSSPSNINGSIIDNQNSAQIICGSVANECLISDSTIAVLGPQTIDKDIIYNGKYLITGKIIYSGEITIDITNCDFIFDGCEAGLYFTNGAKLRANNSVFRPCNELLYWNGITFENTGNNKVHACVIKNAVQGLYLIGPNSETVITNNLFQNNFRGILFENSNNSGSVASNTFDVNNGDATYPLSCMQGNKPNERSFNGIRALNSRIIGSISQNNFICQISKNINERMRGIQFENSTGKITKNNFTNQEISIRIVDNSTSPAIDISANEIEFHSIYDNMNPQIVILNARANITISNNKLNNLSGNSSIDGIDVTNTSVSILENTFSGFRTAIRINKSRYCKVSQNQIINASMYGFYSSNSNDLLLSCNTIKMKQNTHTNTTGLAFLDNDLLSNSNSRIISNCVFDAYIALYMYKSPANISTKFPEIRNNFLYNYYYRGMNFENCTGSVGNSTKYGRNTLYSNIAGTYDVYSNAGNRIKLYYNYMLAPTSQNVSVYNNLQAHSTAYCANQINLSQKVSNADIISCDMDFLISPIGGDIFNPNTILTPLVLIDLGNVGLDTIQSLSVYTALNEEEKLYVHFYFYYVNGKITEAKNSLNQLIALNNSNPTYKILLEKMNALDGNVDQQISNFHTEDSTYNYYSVSALNLNPLNAYDYFLEPYSELQITETKDSRMPEFNSLVIYPNPANSETNLKYDNYDGKEVKIRIIDITGKVLYESTRMENNIDINIPLKDINAGIYIIYIEIDKAILSEKLIVY